MGGKDSPPPPNYGPLIAASQQQQQLSDATANRMIDTSNRQLDLYNEQATRTADQADQYLKMSEDQYQLGKDQYSQVWPYAQQYLQQQLDLGTKAGAYSDEALASSQQQRAQATDQYNYYLNKYQPLETQLTGQVADWMTPDRTEQRAAAAGADVATQINASREAALSNLESYGMDPSTMREASLDAGYRIGTGAGSAAAMTQSRANTEATGLSLLGSAINIGRGYPADVAQQYSTASGTGTGGVTAGTAGGGGLNAYGPVSGALTSAMGSPTSYATLAGNAGNSLLTTGSGLASDFGRSGVSALGVGTSALSPWASALGSEGQYDVGVMNANAAQSQAIGSAIGGAVGFGLGGKKLFG
jgi:hypothetical protein